MPYNAKLRDFLVRWELLLDYGDELLGGFHLL